MTFLHSTSQNVSKGHWTPDTSPSNDRGLELFDAVCRINQPLFIVSEQGQPAAKTNGTLTMEPPSSESQSSSLLAYIPPVPPETLGSSAFCQDHGLRFPFVGGSMAKGISSAAIAEELGHAGMLGFFGAAGLPIEEVRQNISRLKSNLGDKPFGVNLIHSPQEPDLEEALVNLYLNNGIRLIEASAFLALTLSVVRYRVAGIHRDAEGRIVTPNKIIAKISREEVAARFMAPPPEKMLNELVSRGDITQEQAEMAAQIPMAQDVTAEADSGGHTDNRPAIALFPTISALRDQIQEQYGYASPIRVGLGGGIASPSSAFAAFALGADYIVLGSVLQSCIESGTSDVVRTMLAETRQADITMAPAADMFEMGVKVQVLKRGTMFSLRANKLYELYRAYDSLAHIPATEKDKVEKIILQATFDEVWNQTRQYFLRRDPRQVQRAEQDPKHQMALVFRWYLGQSPHWANNGDSARRMDYQIWCGPAMGAFNEWTKGSFLEKPENRKIAIVAQNLLFGAAVAARLNTLRMQGVDLPCNSRIQPLTAAEIDEYLS